MITLSNSEARQLILTSQGFGSKGFGSKKTGVLKTIEHLGYVQIDTIAVVERAHHHTLWVRNSGYRKNYLDELLEKDKSIFEYWSHAAAYLPMRDYRFSLITKARYRNGESVRYNNQKVLKHVYHRIEQEGPLQSKHFEEQKARKGWWEWKETKRALEQLFMEGRLMVSGRSGFQKIYDLTNRVLPAHVNATMPTPAEYGEYLVAKAVRAGGLVAQNEIGYLRSHSRPAVAKALGQMLETGTIVPVKVQGIDGEFFYTTPAIIRRGAKNPVMQGMHILSPFDNLVIQRNRLKRFFNFDYTIECYVPAPKRKYGYFCLPVLAGTSFIARIDCKAERSTQTLVIKKIFYENGIKRTATKTDLISALNNFALFNGCNKIML